MLGSPPHPNGGFPLLAASSIVPVLPSSSLYFSPRLCLRCHLSHWAPHMRPIYARHCSGYVYA